MYGLNCSSLIMVFVYHITYITCETCWDIKLVDLISFVRNMAPLDHYCDFGDYVTT
jgi:hypothetical protein